MSDIRTPGAKGSALDATEAVDTWTRATQTKTSDYTLASTDNRDAFDLGSGCTQITIPDVATLKAACEIGDFECTLNNISGLAITLTCTNAADKINESVADYTIANGENIIIKINHAGDGVNIIGRFKTTPIMSAFGVLAPHKNLIIKYASTTTVDVDADEVLLTDGSAYFMGTSVNYTINMATTGLNALDTGTIGASTEYHVWLVSDGATTGAIASTSGTWAGVNAAITGTYTYYAYLGSFYTNSSSQVVNFHQINTRGYIGGATAIVEGIDTSYTSFDASAYSANALTAILPSKATVAKGIASVDENGDHTVILRIAGDTNGLGQHYMYLVRSISGATEAITTIGTGWSVPLLTSRTLYYRVDIATATANIAITGWEY